MTAADWRMSADPSALLRHARGWPLGRLAGWLTGGAVGRPPRLSERQMRLLVCARFRDRLAELPEADRPPLDELLVEAEDWADGRRPAPPRVIGEVIGEPPEPMGFDPDEQPPPFDARQWRGQLHNWLRFWCHPAAVEPSILFGPLMPSDHPGLADAVRCVLGNPFRPATFRESWRTSTAVGLAEAIHNDRAFDRLPVLADALEEAGCDHPGVLAHCRDGQIHVLGCHVVDGVLNR